MPLLYNSAIPLLDIYPMEMRAYVHINICTLMFTAALFIKSKNWKIQCPLTVEWINMAYYWAIKENEMLKHASTWLILKINILHGEIQTPSTQKGRESV